MDSLTYTRGLAKIVLPVSAAFTTLYAGAFTYTVATGDEDKLERDPTSIVTSGEVKPGWRYDVYERAWPKIYTMDVQGMRQGGGALCVVEVRGYPKPIRAVPGPGATLRVLFDGPLEGATDSQMQIDMMKGSRLRCAARVTNGVVMEETLRPRIDDTAPVAAIAAAG